MNYNVFLYNSMSLNTLVEWNNYISSLESKLINMWSLINCNKFPDNHVELMRNAANNLNWHIISLKNELKKIQLDYNNFINISDRNNKRTRDDVENENDESSRLNEFINDFNRKKLKTVKIDENIN